MTRSLAVAVHLFHSFRDRFAKRLSAQWMKWGMLRAARLKFISYAIPEQGDPQRLLREWTNDDGTCHGAVHVEENLDDAPTDPG